VELVSPYAVSVLVRVRERDYVHILGLASETWHGTKVEQSCSWHTCNSLHDTYTNNHISIGIENQWSSGIGKPQGE
jgi:hypothetical protein